MWEQAPLDLTRSIRADVAIGPDDWESVAEAVEGHVTHGAMPLAASRKPFRSPRSNPWIRTGMCADRRAQSSQISDSGANVDDLSDATRSLNQPLGIVLGGHRSSSSPMPRMNIIFHTCLRQLRRLVCA